MITLAWANNRALWRILMMVETCSATIITAADHSELIYSACFATVTANCVTYLSSYVAGRSIVHGAIALLLSLVDDVDGLRLSQLMIVLAAPACSHSWGLATDHERAHIRVQSRLWSVWKVHWEVASMHCQIVDAFIVLYINDVLFYSCGIVEDWGEMHRIFRMQQATVVLTCAEETTLLISFQNLRLGDYHICRRNNYCLILSSINLIQSFLLLAVL